MMRYSAWATIFMVLFLACESDPSSSDDGSVATGSLSGVITARMGFAPSIPIAGATVELTTASGEKLTGTSAADGSYTIRFIPAGLHTYTTSAPGYLSTEFGYLWEDGEAYTSDIQLSGACEIRGTVLDNATGSPLQPFGTVETYYQGVRVTSDFTDSTGAYAVESLVPVTYTVVAKHFSHNSDSSTVTAGTTPTVVNFRLN